MVESVERWQVAQLTDVSARLVIYRAFIEAELEAARHLDRKVHDLYFNPTVEEFQARTLWSLSNSFTSAFKELAGGHHRSDPHNRHGNWHPSGSILIDPGNYGKPRELQCHRVGSVDRRQSRQHLYDNCRIE